MRTHIAKTAHLQLSIFRLLFDSRHPPLFTQVHRGGCYREKFFLFFWLRFRILFFQNPNFNSISFARYSSSDFSLCIISYWFSLWILIFSFTILDSDYNFGFCVFRFYISTRLISTRINFDLFQHCRFYALTLRLFISLTLLLVINKHLCLCKVCFMLVLAILRLSDVFSLVLGVVYRLGIK